MRQLLAICILVVLASSAFETATAQSSTSDESKLGLQLFGGGAKWAAGNGTSALFINWQDNYEIHGQTDGVDWGPWSPSKNDTYITLSNTLSQSGFNVTFAGDFPSSLSQFSLVVVEAYWACTPQVAPEIENYIQEGGGVVLISGVPCYLSSYSKNWNTETDLSPVTDWFGAGHYQNTGGMARASINDPFNVTIEKNRVIYYTPGGSAAAVSLLDSDAHPVAFWDSGLVFAFTHEFGKGRVYYQADTDIWSSYPQSTSAPTETQKATLTLTCQNSVINSEILVNIKGNLSFNNTSLSKMPIILSYSLTGGETWQELTFVSTEMDGNFEVDWKPSVTGTFYIKATWAGNGTFEATTATISLAVAPFSVQNALDVLSVASNSTISSFAFNSTSQELSFTATGLTNTTGYADVYVAKTLINSTSNVKVFVDGNPLNYTATQTAEFLIIHFTYSHSTHSILVNLSSEASDYANIPAWVEVIAGVIVVVFLVILAIALTIALRKTKS